MFIICLIFFKLYFAGVFIFVLFDCPALLFVTFRPILMVLNGIKCQNPSLWIQDGHHLELVT